MKRISFLSSPPSCGSTFFMCSGRQYSTTSIQSFYFNRSTNCFKKVQNNSVLFSSTVVQNKSSHFPNTIRLFCDDSNVITNNSIPSKAKAIVVEKWGGPEVLQLKDVEIPNRIKPDDVIVKNAAIGVNYVDTYLREGKYESNPPFTPGLEGAGEIVAVGTNVAREFGITVGDRVAYCVGHPYMGSYSQYFSMPAAYAIKLPDDFSYNQGAAMLLQGMTAHYLLHDSYNIKPGDSILVHAAAGGTGQWLCQMGNLLGARVIGTVSTEEKALVAKEAGAEDVIIYTKSDFVEEVKRITHGEGVAAVYDGVGATTFLKGFDCLKLRGSMVLYGAASGQPDAIHPHLLGAKGSITLSRPTLFHFVSTRYEYLRRANDVIRWLSSDKLKLHIHKDILPLAQAQHAHELLEGRNTTGKLILTP